MRGVAALSMAAMLSLVLGGGALAASRDTLSPFAFEPHPGARLPLSTPLIDEHGQPVTIGQFFVGRPVITVLDYLRCKSLCGVTLAGVFAALDGSSLNPGRDFQMLVISIDPRDTPLELSRAKAEYLEHYHRRAASQAIHFLTGTAGSVRQIAEAIGFPFHYDRDTDQYIHPAGFVVASPDGRVSQYILGVGSGIEDLRAALAGAAHGLRLTPFERLVLLCHIEGAPRGRYTVPVMAALMAGTIAAGVGALLIVVRVLRRRRAG